MAGGAVRKLLVVAGLLLLVPHQASAVEPPAQRGFKTVTWESAEGGTQSLTRVEFKRPFSKPPGVLLTMNGTNHRRGPEWHLAAINVTTTDFALEVLSSEDHPGFTRSIKVFWVAYALQ